MKTREEILQDFYEKTGAEPLSISEQKTYKSLFQAKYNLELIENGQKRISEDKINKNTLSQELKTLLESQGLNLETNANEVLHTTSTGYGAELVPDQILSMSVIDLTPSYAGFLSMLPGFHGSNLGKKESVPVIGDEGFMLGNTEWTTAAGAIAQGTHKQKTGEIDIEQSPFIKSIDVSKRLLNYSVVDLEALLKTKIAKSVARTIESCIINGDTETGASGNVNSDDQAPATTFGSAYYHHLMIDHGVRELAINGSSLTVNAGTFDITDLVEVMNILNDLAANPDDCLWLFNRKTYNKALTLEAFYSAAKRGATSTLSGKAITNILGSDLSIARDYPLTEADGRLSKTAGSNTKGGYSLIYKPAIQWGYGQPIEIDVVKIPGKGIQIIETMEVGMTIVQKKAGLTDSSVASAINITL